MSVFECAMRAFFIVSYGICVNRQLESSVVIQELCGVCCRSWHLLSNSRRPEAGVCRYRVRTDIAEAKPARASVERGEGDLFLDFLTELRVSAYFLKNPFLNS